MMRTPCHLRRCVFLVAGAFASLVLLALPAQAAEALRVLTWPGYADPDIVRVFEQRTGRRVEVTVIDSDEALWSKIQGDDSPTNAGKDNAPEQFDVFAVNTAELQRYVRQGLVRPIRTAAIPNLSRLLPRFREPAALPGVAHAGEVFAVPYAYAEMGLIYDRNQLAQAPTSISALWDPRFRGRVLAYNGGVHNVSLAAQSLGLPDPYRLRGGDWREVVDRLIELRRNVLTFYSRPEESAELFRRRNVTLMLANYGSQQVRLLQQAGANVGYVIPSEGALAWLDCWAITRNARDPALAEAWINYLLEEAPGKVLQDRQGLSNTTSPSPYVQPDARLIWLEPVGDTERRNLLWERILSGYNAKKVLAP